MTTVDPLRDVLLAYRTSPVCRTWTDTGDVIEYALEQPSLRFGVVVGDGIPAPGRKFLSRRGASLHYRGDGNS